MAVHLAVETNKYCHNDKSIGVKYKGGKLPKKTLVVNLLELVLKKKAMIFVKLTNKCLDTSHNH